MPTASGVTLRGAMNQPRESLGTPKPSSVEASVAVCWWMLRSFPTITLSTRVPTAERLLDEHALEALPVCEDGQFVGFVDDKAVLRYTPSELSDLDFRETLVDLDRLHDWAHLDKAG